MERTATDQLCEEGSPQHYAWKFPGAPVNIYIQLKTIALLREYVASGLRSDNSQSMEVGGLLLGKVRPQYVEVTDFLSLELNSSSRYFVPNAGDKTRVIDAISSAAERSKEAAVVGFFRSSLQGSLQLSDGDLVFIREYFPEPDNVFLIIAAEETEPLLAGFFFWDSDDVFADTSFMPFPFDEKLLERSDLPAARRELTVTQPTTITATPITRQPRLSLGAAIILGAVTAITGTVFVYARLKTGTDVERSAVVPVSKALAPNTAITLSLSGLLRDSGIEITWDPTLARARVGVLTITDGESRREVPLTQAQLEARKLIYAPASSQVEVALEVFSSEGVRTRESLFFLLPTLPARATPPAARDSKLQEPQEKPGITGATRTFLPPVARQPDTAAQELSVEPPTLQVAAAGLSPMNSSGLPASAGSIAPPAQRIPASATAASETPQASVRELAGVITPPRPLRQVQPLLPRELISTLTRRLDVHVRTFVDVNGKVTKTEIVENTLLNGTDRFLATAALQAARLWTFAPASRGGENISDVIVLQFTFGRGKATAKLPADSRNIRQ
jgi:hypothetical protein